MTAKAANSNPRKLLVRDELLTKAAEVFERQGFASTRIQDVADALSLSRSALYHYFASKEEILTALVEEHVGERAASSRSLDHMQDATPTERLRAALSATIASRLTGGSRLRVLDQLTAEMPPDLRKTFDRGRRRVLESYVRLIEEGIAAGEFRPINPRTAALAILGIASWTSWWYSPGGRSTPEELTRDLVDIALNGLRGSRPRDMSAQRRDKIIAAMRANLDELDQL